MESEEEPIGLRPHDIWFQIVTHNRVKDILAAMVRYNDVGKKIPVEWVLELRGHVDY